MPTVRLPGGPELHYQEWGRPDGAVVLLLHGLDSSSDGWRHVGPALGENFRVIAPDARGHGRSEWTHEYSFDDFHNDVVGLLDQLGILAVILVGHSMGALTAYELAATRPDLIRLLVLEEIPPPDPAQPPRPLPRTPDPTGATDWRAVIAVRRFRNAPPPSWWDYAAQITAKTLVIGGSQSYLPQDRMAELAARIPNGTFTSVDQGHAIHEDKPSDFLGAVQPFIEWFAK
jgi:pimeloyl-ACP methyl ester carboxylesterase